MRMYFRSRTCLVFVLFSFFGSMHSTFAVVTDEAFRDLVRQVEALHGQYITVEDQRNGITGELVGIREQNRVIERNHTAATERHNVRLNDHDQGLARLEERIRALDANKANRNETEARLNAIEVYMRETWRDARSYVGEIKYSLLTERQFQKRYGTSWVLLDGRSVEGSDYVRIVGPTTIPDSRGQFLRCHNGNRNDGRGNPCERECALGTSQMDEIKSHSHRGSVGKGLAKPYTTCSPVLWRDHQPSTVAATNHPLIRQIHVPEVPGIKSQSSAPSHQLGYEPGSHSINRTDDQWSNSDHTHSLTIENTGGLETRPRCMIVNAFIKIHQGRNFNPPAQAGAAAAE